MTKKSQSRLARDAQAKAKHDADLALEKTNVWDGVNEISQSCARLLLAHTGISELVKNKEIIAAITDIKLFTMNVNTLGKDIAALNQELVALRALHEHKTGRAQTPDEHIEGLSLYEKYMLFMERHNNVVMPTATHLAEQIQEAVDRVALQKVGALSPEQDPNVISDAVIKEKPSEGEQQEDAPTVH